MSCTAKHSEVLLSLRPALDSSLKHIISDDALKAEEKCDTYCIFLDYYLEISTLLDPILPSHTAQLCDAFMSRLGNFMAASRGERESSTKMQLLMLLPCRAVYTLSKVRGIKPFSTHLPHQVHHLRFLMPAMLFAEQNLTIHRYWQVRYVIFLWASVAIRVPFPLRTIVPDETIVLSVKLARTALTHPSRISEAAVAFLARFLARRDAAQARHDVISSTVEDGLAATASTNVQAAALALLAAVFKLAHRNDLQPFILVVMPALQTFEPASSIESHRLTKLAHRVALAFLPPRVAAWRYSRVTPRVFASTDLPTKSGVADAIVGDGIVMGHEGAVGDEADGNGDDIGDLSPEDADSLEVVIDLLFDALRNRDSVVRYSAAKGLARLSARLPLEFVRDVVDSLLEAFEEVDEARADAAAHGGCLAVAELVRRGLLLPQEAAFKRAMDAVREAAAFDLRKGAASVGAHVRDAACYAVWAVARGYESACVAPFGGVIAAAMVPIALLDREVNCRRAAAAALQECVGRLDADVFPEGITLITVADYFSLGDRGASYLVVAPKVAKLAGGVYFPPILEELWRRKLVHWDTTVRELAAKALAVLIDVDDNGIIIAQVLPKLVPMATQRGDAIVRHGAALGLSELVSKIGSTGLGSLGEQIRPIPVMLDNKKLMMGRTGDEIQIASCYLIKSLAESAPDVYLKSEDGRRDAEKCLELLERMLGTGKERMYAEATLAYKAMCAHVIVSDEQWHISVTRRVLRGLHESPLAELQRGFALAAGVCGETRMSVEVVSKLCAAMRENRDVEVRRNVARSLAVVPFPTAPADMVRVLETIATGMRDCTTDERGDIGSWVREASMSSFGKVLEQLLAGGGGCVKDEDGLGAAIMLCVQEVIRECCGRIDRTRTTAVRTLQGICAVFAKDSGPFDQLEKVCYELSAIFRFDDSWIDFARNEWVFPAMGQALRVTEVRASIMRGFLNAGGGTRTQFQAPCEALVGYFNRLDDGEAKWNELHTAVLKTVWDRDARLTVPALNVIASLARHGALDGVPVGGLVEAVRAIRACWRGKMRDVKLVMTALGALDELMCTSVSSEGKFEIGEKSVAKECLEAVVVVLGGAIPRLRRIAAENIYVALTMCDVDGFDGGCDKGVLRAMDVVLDTEWEVVSVGKARECRNEVCRELGLQSPVAVTKEAKLGKVNDKATSP